MEFYTKEWDDYIYENWKVGLPLKFYITEQEFLYDDRKLLEEVDYKNLISSEYASFCNNRKKYINSYKDLETKFGKYEVIKISDDLAEEYKTYFIKVENMAKQLKENVLSAINELSKIDINFELELNDNDFILIVLNKTTLKIKLFYEKLKKLCNKYCINSMIDYVENYINVFLTTYDDYLSSISDKFDYKVIDKICFHDSCISKYKKDGNDILMEFDDAWGNSTIKLIFKNCIVSKDIDLTGRCIDYVEYGNYENYKYYMEFNFKSYNLENNFFENELIIFKAERIDVKVSDNCGKSYFYRF